MTLEMKQAAAAVQMLEMMVRSGRAGWNELQQAKDKLTAMQDAVKKATSVNPSNSIGLRAVVTPVVVPLPQVQIIGEDELLSIQAGLSKVADRLNRQMAELSNKLADVPDGTPCPELCRMILGIKDEIETIWDKKRYLERNRCLPEEEPGAMAAMQETSPEKFELAYQKRRLVDFRSKLKKKLEDPKASAAKRHKWETELVQANLEIREIDVKLGTL